MDAHKAAWVEGHCNLKFKFDSSVPGLIQAVSYVKKDIYWFQVKFETEIKRKTIEAHEIDTV